MKKLLLLVVLCCLLAVLGATAGVVSVPSPSKPLPRVAALTVDYVASGKEALAAQNIIAARNYFAQAVAADANNQEANFYLAVTRVFAVFEENYGNTAGLDSVKEIFERTGFTFQTFGLYNVQGSEPVDGPLSTMPRTGEVINFVRDRLLPELDAANANLAKVTSSFTPTSIAPTALGTDGYNLQADYADAMAIKALVNLLKCNLNLLVVYGPDVHIPDIAAAPEQMMTYKKLFSDDPSFLTPRETSRLPIARAALISFIDTFKLASDELLKRSGATNHLFVANVALTSATNEPVQATGESLADINDMLGQVKLALSGPHTFPGDSPEQDRTIDLSKFFVTDPTKAISIRANLSDCAGDLALPDPTFKGLFPYGFSGHQEAVAKAGPHILGVTCAGKGAPMLDVTLNYLSIPSDTGLPLQSMTVELFNRGTKELHVSSITFDGPNASDFTVTPGTQPGACSSLTPTLAVGTSCTATLALKSPAVNYGYLNAYLKIASDDPTKPSKSIFVQGYEYPPPAGVVSGRMRDASTQQGVSGSVQFLDEYGNITRQERTDQNGAFSINGMNSGNYRVKYVPDDGYYLEQWHQGKQSLETADIVKLTPAATTLPDAAIGKAGMIHGVVKDGSNNAPMGNVEITLYDPQTKKPVGYSYADYTGEFGLSHVAPGSYVLKVGNTWGTKAPRWVDVSVTAGSTTMVGDVVLSEGGQISGIVRDAATQAGIRDVYVSVYDSQSGDYINGTGTDPSGVYTIYGLPTGSYKIFFSGEIEGYQKLWYANAGSMAAATARSVTAPNPVTGINMTLARVMPTRTALTGQGGAGQVTLTATVSSSYGIPAGSVIFKERETVLRTAQLDASGRATVTIPLPVGSHYISAYYDGNSSFNVSSSADVWTAVTPQGFDLTVITGGDGYGSVHSNPQGIACSRGSSTDCSNSFPPSSQVTLLPLNSLGSVFSGWGGACSGTGSCTVTMDGAKIVTATFRTQPLSVRIEGDPRTYSSSLGGAFGAVKADWMEVRARAESFTESVILDDPYIMQFKGGFTDDLFSARSGTSFTILSGSLKIRQGTLRVERLKIR